MAELVQYFARLLAAERIVALALVSGQEVQAIARYLGSEREGLPGPLVISALTGLGSLGPASVASGGLGLGGAAIMIFLVAEPLKRGSPAVIDSG